MRTNTENLVSVTELARNASKIVSETAEDGEPRVILKHNRVAAVLVSAEQAKRIGEVDDIIDDLHLWALSLARMATDSGDRHDLNDVIAELGIELDDVLDDDDDGEDA